MTKVPITTLLTSESRRHKSVFCVCIVCACVCIHVRNVYVCKPRVVDTWVAKQHNHTHLTLNIDTAHKHITHILTHTHTTHT